MVAICAPWPSGMFCQVICSGVSRTNPAPFSPEAALTTVAHSSHIPQCIALENRIDAGPRSLPGVLRLVRADLGVELISHRLLLVDGGVVSRGGECAQRLLQGLGCRRCG